MNTNNIELRILVKGRPIAEYFHRGQTFVEGRSGSAYEIELRNANPFRVEAVISVDGLSVLDGKPPAFASNGALSSSGYLIDARENLRVPGWMLNDQQAAAFEFAAKTASYATAMTGHARNNGVIGVMAFRERARSYAAAAWSGVMDAPPWPLLVNTHLPSALYGSSVMGVGVCQTNSSLNVAGAGVLRGVPMNVATQQAATANSTMPAEHSLGTGFGRATDFATTTVTFERGDLHTMMVIYYANARDLKARGIDVGRRREKVAPLPQAFPGMQVGCAPPSNWRG